MTKEDILHHFQDINFHYNNCRMYDDLSRMLDELIAENKGDLISRQAVLEAIEDDNRNGMYSCFASNNDAQCFKQVINELPSEENKGEWKPEDERLSLAESLLFRCSKCNIIFGHQTNFCPNCGADMRGGKK